VLTSTKHIILLKNKGRFYPPLGFLLDLEGPGNLVIHNVLLDGRGNLVGRYVSGEIVHSPARNIGSDGLDLHDFLLLSLNEGPSHTLDGSVGGHLLKDGELELGREIAIDEVLQVVNALLLIEAGVNLLDKAGILLKPLEKNVLDLLQIELLIVAIEKVGLGNEEGTAIRAPEPPHTVAKAKPLGLVVGVASLDEGDMNLFIDSLMSAHIQSGADNTEVLSGVEGEVGEVDGLEEAGTLGSHPGVFGSGGVLDAELLEEIRHGVANFFVSNDFVAIGNPTQSLFGLTMDDGFVAIERPVLTVILLLFHGEKSRHVLALVGAGPHRNPDVRAHIVSLTV
jgi:hypothetical protein